MNTRQVLSRIKRTLLRYGRLSRVLLEPWKQFRFNKPNSGSAARFLFRLDTPKGNEFGLLCTFISLLQQRENWSIVADSQQYQCLPWYMKKSRRVCVMAHQADNTGFVGHITAGTRLHACALTCYRETLEKGADVVYSDQLIRENRHGESKLLLRPGYSVDFLRSQNYTGDILICRANLMSENTRSQWFSGMISPYEMVLRLSRITCRFCRVPLFLYSSENKHEPDEEREILARHLSAAYPGCSVSTGCCSDIYRVRYPISQQEQVSIIIPSRDHVEDLRKCIQSITTQSTWNNYEILVVENGSIEPETKTYYDELRRDGRIRVLEWTKPYNYASINNWAARQARGEYLLFLNNDVEVISSGWIEEMLMYVQRADVGAVGAKLLYSDGTVQHGGVLLGVAGIAGHAYKHLPADSMCNMGQLQAVHNCTAVTGACMMVEKKRYISMGGMDEVLAVAYNDVDLCLQLQARGLLNVYTPYAVLFHHESRTRGSETGLNRQRFEKESAYFREKWAAELQQGDRYHHPLYNRYSEQFAI